MVRKAYAILQRNPMMSGANRTCRKAVNSCLAKAAHRESNSFMPQQRFRKAARNVPRPY